MSEKCCTFKVKFGEDKPMDVKFGEVQVAGSKKGTVLYDREQSLTEEEQAQARENIGAVSGDEVVQADWAESDKNSHAYVKNRDYSYKLVDMVLRRTDDYVLVSPSFTNIVGYSFVVSFDDVELRHVGSNEATRVLEEHGFTYTYNKSEGYRFSPSNPTLKIYKVEDMKKISIELISQEPLSSGGGRQLGLYWTNNYYDVFNDSTHQAVENINMHLAVKREIRTYETFDHANIPLTGDFKICGMSYYSQPGDASEELGLTWSDFPVFLYQYEYRYNVPSFGFVIETKTGNKLLATHNTRGEWTSHSKIPQAWDVEETSSSSSTLHITITSTEDDDGNVTYTCDKTGTEIAEARKSGTAVVEYDGVVYQLAQVRDNACVFLATYDVGYNGDWQGKYFAINPNEDTVDIQLCDLRQLNANFTMLVGESEPAIFYSYDDMVKKIQSWEGAGHTLIGEAPKFTMTTVDLSAREISTLGNGTLYINLADWIVTIAFEDTKNNTRYKIAMPNEKPDDFWDSVDLPFEGIVKADVTIEPISDTADRLTAVEEALGSYINDVDTLIGGNDGNS